MSFVCRFVTFVISVRLCGLIDCMHVATHLTIPVKLTRIFSSRYTVRKHVRNKWKIMNGETARIKLQLLIRSTTQFTCLMKCMRGRSRAPVPHDMFTNSLEHSSIAKSNDNKLSSLRRLSSNIFDYGINLAQYYTLLQYVQTPCVKYFKASPWVPVTM